MKTLAVMVIDIVGKEFDPKVQINSLSQLPHFFNI
jgi:hypothetical protein